MRTRFLNCLPSIWWEPHDIDSQRKHSRPLRLLPSKTRKAQRTRASSMPTPATRRKRNLSITDMPNPELDERTNLQAQSPFFAKLPLELRLTIYEEVLERHVVHFSNAPHGRMRHFICENEEEGLDGKECGCRINEAKPCRTRKIAGWVLGWLGTCRRVYTESLPLLYTLHTYSLLHPHHLEALPQSLLPQRVNQIRTLRLRYPIRGLPYYRRTPRSTPHSSLPSTSTTGKIAYPEDTARWQKCWQIIASMQGLKDLHVVIVDSLWPTAWLEYEEQLLQPVKLVILPRYFELWLPYEDSDTNIDLGGSSCVLRKPARLEDEEGVES